MNTIATTLIGSVSSILDKFVSDKDLNAKLNHELFMAIHSIDVAQTKINIEEAKSGSWFVNSWRPATAWLCLLGLLWHTLLLPVVVTVTSAFGVVLELPAFEIEILIPLLMGMLGLGSLRSFEKSRGVARK